MHTFIVRVWMPDRPGALGAVASRIGAAGGDVVGIEILEQGAGRAIDELMVHLPDPDLVDLLISEVTQVDGVDVEEVRATSDEVHDPRLAALKMASALLAESDRAGLMEVLSREASTITDSDWASIVDLAAGTCLASLGDSPSVAWLLAFLQGASEESPAADVIRATIVPGAITLVLGREKSDFHVRQRERVAALTAIAATRYQEL